MKNCPFCDKNIAEYAGDYHHFYVCYYCGPKGLKAIYENSWSIHNLEFHEYHLTISENEYYIYKNYNGSVNFVFKGKKFPISIKNNLEEVQSYIKQIVLFQ